jgi:hypothetical protein
VAALCSGAEAHPLNEGDDQLANNKWTETDVQNIVNNPVYVGIGPFPAIVDDDTWIKAQISNAEETGIRQTLTNIRKTLQETLGREVSCISHPEWIDESIQEIKMEGAATFFRQLLSQLRLELS